MIEWMIEWMNDWMNDWMNERWIDQTNELRCPGPDHNLKQLSCRTGGIDQVMDYPSRFCLILAKSSHFFKEKEYCR